MKTNEELLLKAIMSNNPREFFPYSAAELAKNGLTHVSLRNSQTLDLNRLDPAAQFRFGEIDIESIRAIDHAVGLGDDGLAAAYESAYSAGGRIRLAFEKKVIIGERDHELQRRYYQYLFLGRKLFPMPIDRARSVANETALREIMTFGDSVRTPNWNVFLSYELETKLEGRSALTLDDLEEHVVSMIDRAFGISLMDRWRAVYRTEAYEKETGATIGKWMTEKMRAMVIVTR